MCDKGEYFLETIGCFRSTDWNRVGTPRVRVMSVRKNYPILLSETIYQPLNDTEEKFIMHPCFKTEQRRGTMRNKDLTRILQEWGFPTKPDLYPCKQSELIHTKAIRIPQSTCPASVVPNIVDTWTEEYKIRHIHNASIHWSITTKFIYPC